MVFGQAFAMVARMETVRLLLAILAQKHWRVFHLDVKLAFLNGILQEEVYVQRPKGFVVKGNEEKVYKLHKPLYGLKQASSKSLVLEDWWLFGGTKFQKESKLYVKSQGGMMIVSLYVDDLLVTGEDDDQINLFKTKFENQLETSSLGEMNYF